MIDRFYIYEMAENFGYQNFLLFPQFFQLFYIRLVKTPVLMVNPLPDKNILYISKLKAFLDDKLDVAKIVDLPFTYKKTFWEKEKMLVTRFSLFPKMF